MLARKTEAGRIAAKARKATVERITDKVIKLSFQEGPQTQFGSTPADIAIYGGAAGGGKSYGLLLDLVRHYDNPEFGAVIFRKNTVQVRNQGGLWDESKKIFGLLRATPIESKLEWTFPHPYRRGYPGAKVKFAHLEHESTVLDHQGSQIPVIGFDELTHFSEYQFWYMVSRNRSTCGVKPYIRATTNPDPDSWVRKLIDWWIGKDGFPVKERSGKIRWFIRLNDTLHWADSKEALHEKFGYGTPTEPIMPKSLTFISSNVYDNKILMEKDPGYLANLLALPRVEKLRLLGGNWNVRATAGDFFNRDSVRVVDAIPSGFIQIVRFWDRAATKPSPTNPDPDWTRGLKLYKYPNNTFLVADVRSMRDTPARVEDLIKNVASQDGRSVKIMSQQDPGSAGVAERDHFIRMLAGYIVDTMITSKDKVTRAKPVSAQWENGNIMVLRAPWNDDFFTELENFPDGAHDDQVDVLSGAFNELSGGGLSTADVF